AGRPSSAVFIASSALSGSRKKSPLTWTPARRPSSTARSTTTSLPPGTLYSPCMLCSLTEAVYTATPGGSRLPSRIRGGIAAEVAGLEEAQPRRIQVAAQGRVDRGQVHRFDPARECIVLQQGFAAVQVRGQVRGQPGAGGGNPPVALQPGPPGRLEFGHGETVAQGARDLLADAALQPRHVLRRHDRG